MFFLLAQIINDEGIINILKATPFVIVVAIILFFFLKWLFQTLNKVGTALIELGEKYLTTINGYFSALSEHNLLTRQAITEGANTHNQSLMKISNASEATNSNLERMGLLLQTTAASLDMRAKAADQDTKKLLDTINERTEQLREQGNSMLTQIKPIQENVSTGFEQMRGILNQIETKMDTNSTTLVNQIVSQFKPVFDDMLSTTTKANALAIQVVEVQQQLERSSRQLESTFLTAIGQIVNSAQRPNGGELKEGTNV